MAVGGGWESGRLGLRELPGATGATSRSYPTEQSIPLAEDLLKIRKVNYGDFVGAQRNCRVEVVKFFPTVGNPGNYVDKNTYTR